MDDAGQSDYEELASDVDNVDELREWLSTQGCKTAGLSPNESLICKYLPPGNVMELFEHYKSTQKLLGAHSVSKLSLLFLSLLLVRELRENTIPHIKKNSIVTYISL